MKEINVKYLADNLHALRDERHIRETNRAKIQIIWEMLSPEASSEEKAEICDNEGEICQEKYKISTDQFQALFIKAVDQYYVRGCLNADLVLMSAGLLKGYSYKVYDNITDRRNRYCEKSDYLKYNPYKDITVFQALSTEQKKGCRDRLERQENKVFFEIAQFLSKQDIPKYKIEIDDYIETANGKITSLKLPLPSYLQNEVKEIDLIDIEHAIEFTKFLENCRGIINRVFGILVVAFLLFFTSSHLAPPSIQDVSSDVIVSDYESGTDTNEVPPYEKSWEEYRGESMARYMLSKIDSCFEENKHEQK